MSIKVGFRYCMILYELIHSISSAKISGLVVSVLAFHSEDLSLNHDEVNKFFR